MVTGRVITSALVLYLAFSLSLTKILAIETNETTAVTDEVTTAAVTGAPFKQSKSPAKKEAKLGVLTEALWPWEGAKGPIVHYYLSGPEGNRPNVSLLKRVLAHVENVTCIRFRQQPMRGDCFDAVDRPTLCVSAENVGDSCFSDEHGCRWGQTGYSGAVREPQTLHVPHAGCPYHEAVRAILVALGMLPYHRRSDREKYVHVAVTAAGTDRLLFAQGLSSVCENFAPEGEYDLLSATHFDTIGSVLRHGDVMAMHAIEDGMVAQVLNIRRQWVIDHKHYNGYGMSFYDKVALNSAYQCQKLNTCGNLGKCHNGGYVDARCQCVCPPTQTGRTCFTRRLPAGEDVFESSCSARLTSPRTFSLQQIGLREQPGLVFYGCDVTVAAADCTRPMLHFNTSSLAPLATEHNPDFKGHNWCELYFTLMLKQSRRGWRGYCLDYFFNEPSLYFMPRSTINTTYGYMKMIVPRPEVFPYIAEIVVNVTFVEVPGCKRKTASEVGHAVHTTRHYTTLTAVGCYLFGLVMGVVLWVAVRALRMPAESSSAGSVATGSVYSGDAAEEATGSLQPTPVPTVVTPTESPAPDRQQLILPPIDSPPPQQQQQQQGLTIDLLRHPVAFIRQSFSRGAGPDQPPTPTPQGRARPYRGGFGSRGGGGGVGGVSAGQGGAPGVPTGRGGPGPARRGRPLRIRGWGRPPPDR